MGHHAANGEKIACMAQPEVHSTKTLAPLHRDHRIPTSLPFQSNEYYVGAFIITVYAGLQR
jgi:hypothetical protein